MIAPPQDKTDIRHVIAKGNLVAIDCHSTMNPQDRARAVIGIFRVENGKAVEHWDVVQDVPEKSANSHTMF